MSMIHDLQVNNFKNWALENIKINWEDGKISILISKDRNFKIEILNFPQLRISRDLFVKDNLSIEAVSMEPTQIKTILFRIELQTGDIHEFEGFDVKISEI